MDPKYTEAIVNDVASGVEVIAEYRGETKVCKATGETLHTLYHPVFQPDGKRHALVESVRRWL